MDDLTNLLPADRLKAVRRRYFLRLASLAALMLALVIVFHGVLLIPAYAYLSEDMHGKQVRVDALSATNLTPAETAASARLAALSSEAATLASLKAAPTMSGAATLILGVPRAGIRLNGFALAAAADGGGMSVTVSGIADTRESLHDYVTALQAAPWAKSASVPISAYAQESDVPFTITIEGSFVSP